ncbi:hypothetical protein K466DRAFT_607021 [Polyporus arcularius HHB13444]|uniref:Uncharacterized protein n=1 Tax=Polyporus arcularius HHB13444 TaxID=1314778 RepID=A0A5C3NN21_9APHY|nr:hypothetical protein K466DRAFT_607021 [Polyporus arcularius HHB13444]
MQYRSHLDDLQDTFPHDNNQYRQQQHTPYNDPKAQYRTAMNVPQTPMGYPMVPTMSFHDLSMRLQRVEQDLAHLRQVQAEQRVEITELRRRNVRGGKIGKYTPRVMRI